MAGVYEHIRLDKNQPFYYGIFKKEYRPFEKTRRNNLWDKIVAKTDYKINIIKEGLTWEEACQMERDLIKQYGRIDKGTGILANLTDGGDGTVGLIRTEEHTKKISESQKGKTYSKETKEKIALGMMEYAKINGPWNKGKKTSDETKRKLSEAKKGKTGNPNSINAMVKANKGIKRSPETIEKMRIAALNRKPMTDETKKKISLSVSKILTGRKCSEETKRKISNSLKNRT
jgi:hypothetical protein